MTKAVLLDIEGTVGDIAFVRDVLFPFARKRLGQTLRTLWTDPAVAAIVTEAAAAAGKPLTSSDAATDQFIEWMDEDRKITPLKALQGIIWRDGYASGELKAHLYPDAVEAIDAWRKKGLRVFIYSSGSIEAQKLYFAHSIAGDLTGAIERYFDTTTGPKAAPESYTKIAKAIGLQPNQILFLTDAPAEAAAAKAAGLQACRIDRERARDFVADEDGTRVLGSFASLIG
ncbi:MAG: acireductone synthase [Alphaproteobacteria bacterium]|nr:acireductone synthase [Alphaproteobacteria bacterium]